MSKIYLVKVPKDFIPMYIYKEVKDSIDVELGHYYEPVDDDETFEFCDKIFLKVGESFAKLMCGKIVTYTMSNAFGLMSSIEICRKKGFLVREFDCPGETSFIINVADYILKEIKI